MKNNIQAQSTQQTVRLTQSVCIARVHCCHCCKTNKSIMISFLFHKLFLCYIVFFLFFLKQIDSFSTNNIGFIIHHQRCIVSSSSLSMKNRQRRILQKYQQQSSFLKVQQEQKLRTTTPSSSITTSTSLNVLLDVPDGFFTVTFPVLGILLSISKSYGRVRMEERAWEQRLEDSRMIILQNNPTITELDLRRKEAAMEWSAYGPRSSNKNNNNNNAVNSDNNVRRQQQQEMQRSNKSRRRRVDVLDRDDDEVEDDDSSSYSSSTTIRPMNDDEIEAFEQLYGIQYDPYYDEPYTEEELPTDMKYSVDRIYGDRIYENGEIFYKSVTVNNDDNNNDNNGTTVVYWRQGSKPRNGNKFRFWG